MMYSFRIIFFKQKTAYEIYQCDWSSDRVLFRSPDDATRILKLQAGEVDGAELIPYARVAELKADANIDMELYPSTKVEFLTLNVRPKLKDGSDNPLANEKIRQALNSAIDKTAIIKLVTYDVGTPTISYMSSGTP